MQPRPVCESQVVMTELVLPSHTNSLGSIFGGQVMSWIDICGAIAAQRHSRRNCVTASVDALQFIAPVFKGWIVNLRASVNYAGKSSMEVGVRVDAENPTTGETFHTASAYLTFVALDENKKPALIPQVLAETPEQVRRQKAAAVRRQHRLELRNKMT
jgi:acyl-CoA hydrolase